MSPWCCGPCLNDQLLILYRDVSFSATLSSTRTSADQGCSLGEDAPGENRDSAEAEEDPGLSSQRDLESQQREVSVVCRVCRAGHVLPLSPWGSALQASGSQQVPGPTSPPLDHRKPFRRVLSRPFPRGRAWLVEVRELPPAQLCSARAGCAQAAGCLLLPLARSLTSFPLTHDPCCLLPRQSRPTVQAHLSGLAQDWLLPASISEFLLGVAISSLSRGYLNISDMFHMPSRLQVSSQLMACLTAGGLGLPPSPPSSGSLHLLPAAPKHTQTSPHHF